VSGPRRAPVCNPLDPPAGRSYLRAAGVRTNVSTVIRTRGLTRDFANVRAVDGLDLEVPARGIFGFLGPNGAGKTTTIHLLLGLLRPTSGHAEVLGRDPWQDGDDVRARCGALLEHHGLYERLSAQANLDYYARINRVPTHERDRRVRDALEPLGLWERRKEAVGTWSKGMKQKLAIARALLHGPDLVFLDEPTAGHDAKSAHELREALVGLVRSRGLTVFLTTHNLVEAERICDGVGVIRSGRLVAQGRPDEVRRGAGRPRLEVHGGPWKVRALTALRRRKEVLSVEAQDGWLRLELADAAPAAPLVRLLVENGCNVEEVRRGSASLEDAFLKILEAPE
jgi:ABC-2 type transport system ATP-binding protein